jgi:hypothetical protein
VSRVVIVGVLGLALVGCGDSDNDAGGADAAPSTAEIVDATSGVASVEFGIDVESQATIVLRADGVLDVATIAGHRVDASDFDGSGLAPIAEVWLDGGRLYEVAVGEPGPATPINGGLANFLGIADPTAPASLDAVLGNWLGESEPQVIGTETIDGASTVHLVVDRSPDVTLDIWVDSASRLRQAREVADDVTATTTTHQFSYLDQAAAIPPRP